MEWRTLAKCRDSNPDRFYEDSAQGRIIAKATCRVCPVQKVCLAEALLNDEKHGVWGGKDTKERGPMVTILAHSGFRIDLSHDTPTLAVNG